jgi:hypothetical protein
MAKIKAVCGAVGALLLGTLNAWSAEWPQLRGSHERRECVQALQLGKAAFRSNSMYVYGPLPIPSKFGSTVALQPESLGTDAGDNLVEDPTVFHKLLGRGTRSVSATYLQVMPQYGYRLVVREVTHSWRGEVYFLFSADATVNASDIANAEIDGPADKRVVPIWTDQYRWKPPIVFRDSHTQSLWVVDVGQPFVFLGDWRVLVPEPGGLSQPCTVVFRPSVTTAANLLPPAVRELARLLDGALGNGEDEGTLQPTARIRTGTQHTLANAALRPWALTDPYNTRQEVDAGLATWMKENESHAAAYRDIQHQYPIAERALAAYYRNRFKRTPAEANRLAAYVADVLFRSYFVFHSEDPHKYLRGDHPAPNPWRQSIVGWRADRPNLNRKGPAP